jgi:major membrane immunogen (membrane-anchored lipoprotein)
MKTKLLSTTLLAASLLIGCSKKDEQAMKAADAASQAANHMAQQGTANGAAGKTPGIAVPSKTLATFLPSISGYTLQGEPETMDMDMSGVKYTNATAKYKNGDKQITVSMFDYNYISGLSGAYTAMMSMNMETNEESWHSEKIGGFPAWSDWKKKDNEGSIGVVVNDRIFIITEGHGGVSQDELKSAVSSINLGGLAGAAK